MLVNCQRYRSDHVWSSKIFNRLNRNQHSRTIKSKRPLHSFRICFCNFFLLLHISMYLLALFFISLSFIQSKEAGSICWWQGKIIDRDSSDVGAIECTAAMEHRIFITCNTGLHKSWCTWSMDGNIQAASIRLLEVSVNFSIKNLSFSDRWTLFRNIPS